MSLRISGLVAETLRSKCSYKYSEMYMCTSEVVAHRDCLGGEGKLIGLVGVSELCLEAYDLIVLGERGIGSFQTQEQHLQGRGAFGEPHTAQ